MNMHAIEVLEEARLGAEAGPIKGTAAVRLALSWLSLNKVAEGWQVDSYWAALTKPPTAHGMAAYVRTRDMKICVDRWRTVVSGKG